VESQRTTGIYTGRILKMLWGGSGEHISIAAMKPTRWSPTVTKPKTKTVNDFSRCLDAQQPGGLHVAHELELGRLLRRQVGRFLPLEDAADMDAGLAKQVRNA
jgi:hypothetical protein